MTGRRVFGVVLMLAAGCTACESQPREGSLEVYFDGCREVRASGECTVAGSSTTLTFWVKTPEAAAVQVLFDGRAAASKAIAVQGGVRVRAVVEHAPVLVTLARSDGPEQPEGGWSLHVLPSSDPGSLVNAERLRDAGEFDAAETALAPIRQHPDLGVRANVLGLLGRIALARGDHKEAIADLELLALEQSGRRDAAIEVYERAETVLDHVRFNAPLGGGRDTFLADRLESASRLIELLLRAGRTEEALRTARRSRSRALSALAWPSRLDATPEEVRRGWYAAVTELQQRRKARERDAAADWELSTQELEQVLADRAQREDSARDLLDEALASLDSRSEDAPPPLAPSAGELVMVYHPIPSGWVGFAVSRDGMVARRLRPGPPGSRAPEQAADWLLGPFAALIERSDRLRVLAFGALNQIDVHALPWKGRPLIASIAVQYGVDVARLARPVGAG